jgi:hypothetical protein
MRKMRFKSRRLTLNTREASRHTVCDDAIGGGPNRTLTEVYSAATHHSAFTDNYKALFLDHSSYVVD